MTESSPPNNPRIDDSLAVRYEQRLAIEGLLRDALKPNATPPQLALLRQRAQAISKNAPEILLDLALHAAQDISNLALLLLAEVEDPAIDEQIEARLARLGLTEDEQLRLLAIKAFVHGDASGVMDQLKDMGEPMELLSKASGQFWSQLSPAEMVVLWIQRMASLQVEEKLAMLETFARVARESFPALGRIEAGAGDESIDRFFAQALSEFPTPESLSVLRRLSASADPATRSFAESSIAQLLAGRPDLQPLHAENDPLAGGELYEGYLASDPISSQQGVILSRRSSHGISFCVALIDLPDHGILDLWGNTGFSAQEFRDLIRSLNPFDENAVDAWTYCPAPAESVLALLRKADDVLRGKSMQNLPPGFQLWSALWRN